MRQSCHHSRINRFPLRDQKALARTGTATVLVGMTDSSERASVVDMLYQEGHVVVPASDGVHLIEFMADAILNASDNLRPDLIIADAILPGCTGLSLLSGLRALNWDTAIILLAPYSDLALRREASQRGVTALLARPCNVERLRNITREILGHGGGREEHQHAVEAALHVVQ